MAGLRFLLLLVGLTDGVTDEAPVGAALWQLVLVVVGNYCSCNLHSFEEVCLGFDRGPMPLICWQWYVGLWLYQCSSISHAFGGTSFICVFVVGHGQYGIFRIGVSLWSTGADAYLLCYHAMVCHCHGVIWVLTCVDSHAELVI